MSSHFVYGGTGVYTEILHIYYMNVYDWISPHTHEYVQYVMYVCNMYVCMVPW